MLAIAQNNKEPFNRSLRMCRNKFLLSILSPPTYIRFKEILSVIIYLEYVSNVSRYISRSWTVHAATGVLVSMTSETVNVIGEKNQSPINSGVLNHGHHLTGFSIRLFFPSDYSLRKFIDFLWPHDSWTCFIVNFNSFEWYPTVVNKIYISIGFVLQSKKWIFFFFRMCGERP